MAILSSIIFSLHSCRAFAFNAQHMMARSAAGGNLLHGHPIAHRPGTVLFGRDLTSLEERDDDGGDGVVAVTVQRTLPGVASREARDAWIEYHWKKGGGLPLVIVNDEVAEESPAVDGGAHVLERTIVPMFMKERLEYDEGTRDETDSLGLRYTVAEAGPFFADVIPGSHSAVVRFDSTSSSPDCVMTWNVTFSTTRWASFYETMTQWTVGTAATTVREASATPRLFSAQTTISNDSDNAIDPLFARNEVLDFVFARGGGLPLPPPIPYGDVLDEGGGSARRNLLRIPPLITESVVDSNSAPDGTTADFTYRLNDPGWFTFPFLLHTHLGRVRFTTPSEDSSSLVIEWEVEIRPYEAASPLVEKLIEMTVSTLLRNVRVRLTQPGAVVDVKPPRGNADLLTGRTSFGSVAKETWLGGVLDSHLSDKRSTMEQTASLFRPWTWGGSGTGDEDDCVRFRWTDGFSTQPNL